MTEKITSLGELVECESSNCRDEKIPFLSGVEIRTDFEAMINEIKTYTTEHPGRIFHADIPMHQMLGFVHEDGKYWAIKMSDGFASYGSLIPAGLTKQNICGFLSNDNSAEIFKKQLEEGLRVAMLSFVRRFCLF